MADARESEARGLEWTAPAAGPALRFSPAVSAARHWCSRSLYSILRSREPVPATVRLLLQVRGLGGTRPGMFYVPIANPLTRSVRSKERVIASGADNALRKLGISVSISAFTAQGTATAHSFARTWRPRCGAAQERPSSAAPRCSWSGADTAHPAGFATCRVRATTRQVRGGAGASRARP